MAGVSETKDVKSPQEIEEEINSSPTVTWDPFTVLPKEIYVKIFDKLYSPSDKQNFMNAHVKWYELFESKRTFFLFGKVLKEVVRKYDRKVRFGSGWHQAFNKYMGCLFVCRDWNHGAQNVFQLHDCYFKIEGEEKTFGQRIAYAPHNSFIWLSAREAEKDLEMFSATHPPSRNPFFSRRVTLLPISDVGLLRGLAWEKAYDKIVLAFDEETYDLIPVEGEVNEDNWRELAEVYREFEGVEPMERYRTSVGAILDRYGKHIYHCKVEIIEKLNPDACLIIAKWLDLMPELKTLMIENREYVPGTYSESELKEIEEMQLVPPELKNLVFLNYSDLPPIAFNKLFGNLAPEKIQIDAWEGAVFRDFEFERRNLTEAFLTLKGFDDWKHLEDTEPFPNLKKLVIKLHFETHEERINRTYSKFFELKMIFSILEEKFPELEELTLRLPEAESDEDKQTVIDQSLECQLNLPRLKKLWISFPNLCSLDFIFPCTALEELRVIRGRMWGLQKYIGLRSIRGKTMDLKNMCESSIWKAFPKLRVLKITDGR